MASKDEQEKAPNESSEVAEMTREWVLKKYKGLIERCEASEPQVAKGALDSVAKHLGMFKEIIEARVTTEKGSYEQMLLAVLNNELPKNPEDATDEQIMQRYTK
jgi:hypothetical protein